MRKLAKSLLHLPFGKTVADGEMSKGIDQTQPVKGSSILQTSASPSLVVSSSEPPESTQQPMYPNGVETIDVDGYIGEGHRHPYKQPGLPRLPIPPLEDTLQRYVRALEGLQDAREHEATKRAVDDFLKGEGPRIQEKLIAYASDKARYVLLHSIDFDRDG